MDDAVRFLQEMIQIDSSNPPGNEHEIAKALAKRCESTGIPYHITPFESNRSNLEIHLKGKGQGKLLFCGHMDTVLPGQQPWRSPPFSAQIEGEKLYGRGTSDMKSGLCAMYLAVESLFLEQKELEKDIVFLATAGEEVDSCGAREYLKDQNLEDVEAMVIGEPTKEKVVIGHKGAFWLNITLCGKTAHGSMPEEGINAVEWSQKVMEMIESLKSDWNISAASLGTSSMAVTKIDGGVQTNVIPDRCSLGIDIRSVPPQSHEQLLAKINEKLTTLLSGDGAPAFFVETELDRPSIRTDKANPIISTALEIKELDRDDVHGVSYYTDGAVLNPESKIPTLIYGPGDEK